MKADHVQFHRTSSTGFTLVELIGVLAIIAIMTAVIAPNALHSIERAAVRAEADTLHNLGEQVKLYLRDTAAVPTSANWNTVLATYASLSPTDLLTNRRQMTRIYVPDPIVANQRAMLLSSMRNGVALPAAATISGSFATVWNTADGNVPAAGGWVAWNVNNIEYLVIERINLSAIYRTDLLSYTITLNNKGAGTVSYNLVLADGTIQAAVNIIAGATATLTNRRARDRVNLYRAAGGVTLDYSYVLSTTGKTFDFNGTNWIPQ
jgi:type II secretory pathway pseudopilin PulG